MIIALKWFGLPPKLLRVIQHIYEDRSFRVSDGTKQSSVRSQKSGISQGCPLSPFLFVMLMTVVVKDSIAALSPETQASMHAGLLDAVLYADDTLLIGASDSRLQELLISVADTGSKYGLALHWSKFQLLEVNGCFKLQAPDGTTIEPDDALTYLGATIFSDGGIKSELNRKLGTAWGEHGTGQNLESHELEQMPQSTNSSCNFRHSFALWAELGMAKCC